MTTLYQHIAAAALLLAASGAHATPVQASQHDDTTYPDTEVSWFSGTTAELGTVDIRRLTERVVKLERRLDERGEEALAPTAAESKRTRQEEEQQAEFQKQVWTMP
jgi:hypothetical protein